MRFRFIEKNGFEFPVEGMCDVLGVSRSGYYAWASREQSTRAKTDEELLEKITVIFEQSRQTYGSPRVYHELKKLGINCSKKRVAKLMRQKSLVSVRFKRFRPQTTDSDHDLPIAENILDRDFVATAPNQKWVGDITYIWTTQGWLYSAVIIDLFSRKVVGWAAGNSASAQLACQAFEMAVFRRGKPLDLVFHSDRGVQYASEKFRNSLQSMFVTPSMSRKGNCYDNAVAESFFNTLKVEFVYRYNFKTRYAAKILLANFIEEFYNSNRLHSSIGYLSPVEFEHYMRFERGSTVH